MPETQNIPSAVSVVGLGKLGGPYAAMLAHRGFKVFGVDNNPARLALLANQDAPLPEPGFRDLLTKAGARLELSSDLKHAITNSDMTFLFLPTPSTQDQSHDTSVLAQVCNDIARYIGEKTKRQHDIISCSTVAPGSTRKVFAPLKQAAEEIGPEFELGLCLVPEILALGNIIHDIQYQDMILIGTNHTAAADRAEATIRQLTLNNPPCVRGTIEETEMAKLATNAYVAVKVAFANHLGALAQELTAGAPSGQPALDAKVIARMVGVDRRIGRSYLTPATAYGGPCLPRDVVAMAGLFTKHGITAGLLRGCDSDNRAHTDRLISQICADLPQSGRVAVLGLTFKPDSDNLEHSTGLAVANALAKAGHKVTVCDPEALVSAAGLLDPNIDRLALEDIELAALDTLVITTPWPQFARLAQAAKARGLRLIDPWRLGEQASFT